MHPVTSAVVWSIYGLLCASAWIPLEARSNNEVDLGTLSGMKEFLTKMGFDANSTWEEITDHETTNLDATLESSSPRTSPTAVFLAERADTCEDLTGFSKILCDNMPDRAAWWAAGGALAIWYLPDYLVKWCDAIAHVLVTARSLRQMRDGGDLNREELSGPGIGGGPRIPKRGDPNTNYKFSIPAIVNGVPVEKRSDEDTPEWQLLNTYVFNADDQTIHYHSTKGVFSSSSSEISQRSGSLRNRQTSDYSIVIQATALHPQNTIASESCVSSVVKWHINRATEQNRFKCVPLDNRGSWLMALHVNVNHGRNNNGEYGECCDFS